MQPHIETKFTHFPKKCIVMDFDGTLVDSMKIHANAWSFSLTTINPNLDSEEIKKELQHLSGFDGETVRQKMLHKFNLQDMSEEARRLRSEFREKINFQDFEIKGTKLLLQTLYANGHSMIIHSNGDRYLIQPLLEKLDYLKYFDEVVLGNEFGVLKPNAEMLLDLMKRKDYKPEDLVYWGDNEVDKQYAENAGIDYVVTNTSFPRKDLVSIFTNQK